MEDNQFRTDLAYLLSQEEEAASNVVETKTVLEKRIEEPLKASKNATLFNFIEMVGKIVSKSMAEDRVEFVLDEGKRLTTDPNEKVEHPYITYKVIERKPIIELKPRERESIREIVDNDSDKRQGRVYGQKFQSYIQFNIIASEYRAADRVMNIFEELIFSYTHYFKRNGVGEILFHEHLTDKDYDVYRQNLSVRNLVYYVEIEKLYVMFDSDIDGLLIK